MPVSAEIIDFRAARERRRAVAQAVPPVTMPPVMAWVPVWFFMPCWMGLPASVAWQVNG